MVTVRPLVSVVLPVHDAVGYLDRTFDQLRQLDGTMAYQFVIIDDHSDDDSLHVVRGWRDLPGEVTVLSAEGRGVALARNQALRSCRGTYVWLTDADDRWEPTVVTEMVRVAEETRADVVACNAIKRTPDGAEVGRIQDARTTEVTDGGEAFLRLLEGTLQGHLWNKLFRREVLGRDPFPSTRAHSDLGGMISVLPRAERVAYLPRDLYVYLQNPGSILNGRAFEPANLLRCLELARDTSVKGGTRAARALEVFTYRNVALPLLNEVARRRPDLDPLVVDETLSHVAAMTTPRGALGLLRSASTMRERGQAVLATVSVRGYVGAYSLAGSRFR